MTVVEARALIGELAGERTTSSALYNFFVDLQFNSQVRFVARRAFSRVRAIRGTPLHSVISKFWKLNWPLRAVFVAPKMAKHKQPDTQVAGTYMFSVCLRELDGRHVQGTSVAVPGAYRKQACDFDRVLSHPSTTRLAVMPATGGSRRLLSRPTTHRLLSRFFFLAAGQRARTGSDVRCCVEHSFGSEAFVFVLREAHELPVTTGGWVRTTAGRRDGYRVSNLGKESKALVVELLAFLS